MFTFFTEIINKGIIDKNGRWLGRPYDFLVAPLGEAYPKISAIVVASGKIARKYAVIPWDQVQRTNEQFHIKAAKESLEYKGEYYHEPETTVRKHILDQQVVDTYNRKVVRVNDVHMLKVDNELRIAHVDIGLRGMVRRLGWQPYIDFGVNFINPHAAYLSKEGFLAWKYVQPLSIHPDKGTIQLNVTQTQIKSIPPPDLSEMLKELDPYQRAGLFRSLDTDTQIGIITEMDIKQQKDLIRVLDSKTSGALFEKIPPDEGADLLGELPRRDADRILSYIGTKKSKKLSTLLSHKSSSAGGLMTTEFITLSNAMSVGEAIEHIKQLQTTAETIYYAYVVDAENHLEGAVTFKHLLFESNDRKVADIMLTKPACVHVDASAKEVAYIIDKYNLMAIPVIDHNKVLQGMITIDDILSLVISETWGKKTGLL
ncbi:MAG: magnesium transporter [Deltaproteobacteria bacterium]|nr:magnesium transporter [Deltaproteobacteria bacterium]MBI2341327.1 magnesium transporter [Deltaproteobacteria bacterium]